MKALDLYGRIRYAVQREGLSKREAVRHFGIDPRTVAKMLVFSVPPGYRRLSGSKLLIIDELEFVPLSQGPLREACLITHRSSGICAHCRWSGVEGPLASAFGVADHLVRLIGEMT
jgi:hypothetical protein